MSVDKTINVFDGKVGERIVFDSQTGEFLRTLPMESAHQKGIYGVGWDPDNQHFYTASADDTVKVIEE